MHLHQFDRTTGHNTDRDRLFQDVTERAAVTLGLDDRAFKYESVDHIFERHLLQPLHLNRQISHVSDHMRSLLDHRGDAAIPAAAPLPPVVVAFDECIEMNVRQENGGINPLNSLRRAWCWISDIRSKQRTLSFWLVLMSTSSSAAHLVEHIDAKTSIRAKDSVSLPTFVGVGFDVLLPEQQRLSRAQQAFSLEHLIAYGRPLWSSLEPRSFWPTVRFKLLFADHPSVDDALHCYSIMASRLALSLVPTYSPGSSMFATQKLFMDRQVDRHMPIVTHVTPEASMYVDSPSEPVLAISASLIMLPSAQKEEQFVKKPDRLTSNTYGSILENFCQRCLHGADVTLYKGTHGELASRIALMAACDAVKRKRLDQLPLPLQDLIHVEIVSHAVPLEHMLAGLANLDDDNRAQLCQRIGDVHAAALRTSRSALLLGAALEKTAASDMKPQAWINFTHFDVLPDPISQITPEYLWYCWKRGVALQMAHGQHGIDGIVPVFLGRLDQPFARSADANNDDVVDEMHAARYMTYIAWEAKNRSIAQGQPSDRHEAAKLAGPPITHAAIAPQEPPLTERALISVLFDLGTRTVFGDVSRGLRPRLQPIADQKCPRLVIRGMSDKHAYPCLDELKLHGIFSKILATTTTGVGSYEQLNSMPKPMWNEQVQPTLASISGAQEQDQVQQQQTQTQMQTQARPHGGASMDLD